MPVNRLRRSSISRKGARGKVVALLLAVVWLLFLVTLGAHSVSATPLQHTIAAVDTPTDTPSSQPTNTPTTAPPTPTNTPRFGHPTPTTSGSVTPTGSTTATVAPTATTSTGGTGNGDPNDPGSGNGQATKVVLAQPTYAGTADNSQQGLSVASFGSNGLIFASVMSCIVGILGIVVAVIAIQRLRTGGYGPFLRALLLGKRANQPPATNGAVAASGASGVRRAGWRTDERGDYSAEGESFSGFGTRAPPSGPGRRPPPGANSPRGRASGPDW